MSNVNTNTNTNATENQDPATLIGLPAEHDGFLWTIDAVSRGWYTLRSSDGTTKKARRADFDLLEDEDEANASHKMTQTLKQYRETYVPTLAFSGKKSLSNGDSIAMLLSGLDYQSVYALAEYWCELASGSLDAKYRHLKNDGMRRMNAGNRLRALFKKADQGNVEEGSKADQFHEWVLDDELRAKSKIVAGQHGGRLFLRYGVEATGEDAGEDKSDA